MEPTPELRELRERLTALYRSAGEPTPAELTSAAELADGARLPKQTISTLLTEDSPVVPRWSTVEAFVLACQHLASKRRPPKPLSPAEADLDSWRNLHQRATQARRSRTSDPSGTSASASGRSGIPRMHFENIGAINVGDRQHVVMTVHNTVQRES